MAKGEHKKINRPTQGGYDISLDPKNHNVMWVTVRFGTLEGKDYKWDLSLGPIEFASKTKKKVITVDDDQLPAAVHSCYYQLLCEIADEEDELETLLTEPTLLSGVSETNNKDEELLNLQNA